MIVPMMLMFAGLWDFLNAIMTPIHAAISLVLMLAYRGWSMVFGADAGITWVASIMTMVVVVRTILIPLFIRQINSARNMQLIQPKMKALQEKYGADRQQLGIETQKLMKAEGVSPTASCVPLLLQMPVFFGLYQVLYAASATPNEPRGYFFVQNPDLVQSLNQSVFLGARLSDHFWMEDWSLFGATQILAIILVLLMAGLLFITQRQLMTKNMAADALTGPMAQQQKMMLYLFPAMYLFTGAVIPVGVLVYWVTNNLWTMIQQWLLIRNNPTPGTPAYVEWEERMIRQGKDPQEIAEQRRAKHSKKPAANPGSTSRQVGSRPGGPGQGGSGNGGPNRNGGTGGDQPNGGNSGSSSGNGVSRQQIQRQQPNRQSRSNRQVKKKDNGGKQA